MIPTNNNLTCLVFGHNYFKLNRKDKGKQKLVCKNCNVTVYSDAQGNFNANTHEDKTLENTLKKLYLLNRKLAG